MENIILFDSSPIIKGTILHRPSKNIKSPYVADVILEDGTEILAHCPSLGCCGLSNSGSSVYLTKNTGISTKTSHRVDLAIYQELNHNISYKEIIGLNPKISEKIGFNAIKNNCIQELQNVKLLETEKTFGNSRFDIYGIDNENKEFILEIKTVPLADYVDCDKKDRKNYVDLIEQKMFNEKIAYFPDGYRKNKNDPISPRALKHIQELETIVLEGKYRCFLLFIVQRTDVSCFQTSVIDTIYKEAVLKASNNGVKILVLQVDWNKEDGKAYFYSNNLPIIL
jgi:sugar fermentation stimulation protein A